MLFPYRTAVWRIRRRRQAGVAAGIGGSRFVVKAQVHAGGRGKGGGIKTATSPAEVEKIAQAMLGSQLVTPQTGAEGKRINKVLVEEGVDIAREIYLGITVDRANECPGHHCEQ